MGHSESALARSRAGLGHGTWGGLFVLDVGESKCRLFF